MRAAIFIAAMALTGCPRPRSIAPHLTAVELGAVPALSRTELRARVKPPNTDVRQTVRIAITERISGRGFEGRGALVVRPGVGLRMILLGPGGSTAMDVWLQDDRFRVAIPALDRVVRGDASTPRSTLRGMPVDLLRRWLVAPFGGALVHARPGIVTTDGHLAPGEGTIAFTLFGKDMVVRAREGDRERGWFFSHGAMHGRVDGRVVMLPNGTWFPSEVTFEGDDPPMTVAVSAEATELAPALPAATFADPDGP